MIDMPAADYIGGMYSSVAWQYLTFYSGIVKDGEDNRLMTKKHLSETFPEYDDSFDGSNSSEPEYTVKEYDNILDFEEDGVLSA